MASIKFGTVKIDSLKIIIPMAEVQVIDGKFNQEYTNIKLYPTGEVLETPNRDIKQFCSSNGIKVKIEVVLVKYGFVSQLGFKGEEFLVFQPSSKFLKENYFDGINLDNLPVIYNYLLNLNIVHFSYESLLQARFADVDFCIDYPMSLDEFRAINKNIEYNVLQELKHLVEPFLNYTGLQFNKRERATPTRPFLKFYHKSTELTNNSNEFYNEYLKDNHSEIISNGVGRYEVTVKNAKFKKHYKIESMTFEELLNIPYESVKNMFKRFLPNYLYKSIRQKKMATTPTETIHLNCINQFIQDGKSEQEIMHLMLKGIEEKMSKSRSKKLLQGLFQQVNNLTQLGQNNESKKDLNDFYKSIGFHED